MPQPMFGTHYSHLGHLNADTALTVLKHASISMELWGDYAFIVAMYRYNRSPKKILDSKSPI